MAGLGSRGQHPGPGLEHWEGEVGLGAQPGLCFQGSHSLFLQLLLLMEPPGWVGAS